MTKFPVPGLTTNDDGSQVLVKGLCYGLATIDLNYALPTRDIRAIREKLKEIEAIVIKGVESQVFIQPILI